MLNFYCTLQYLVIIHSELNDNSEANPTNLTVSTGCGYQHTCFTLLVFDLRAGKVSCSFVSKDGVAPGSPSDGVSNSSVSSDVVNQLNKEARATESIVSAGVFKVWKGLFH